MKPNTQFFLCNCGADAIGLEVWDLEDDQRGVCLSFWSWGHDRLYGWEYRLRHIWHIIRHGHPFTDSVILSMEQAKELGMNLVEIVKEKNT